MMSALKNIVILFAFAFIFSCSDAELNLSKANIPTLNKINDSLRIEAQKCDETPTKSAGTFPIKFPTPTPGNLLRSDITDGKSGVELNVELIIEYQGTVLENASVDIWHCDSEGNFSQYGVSTFLNFLRGRQITDVNGKVLFKTIFPGWIKDRAAHIYVEVKKNDGTSIKVTQLALTQEMQDKVFVTSGYQGLSTTKNINDTVFKNSLICNLPDKSIGSSVYTIIKKIIIK